jgi:ribosomal protein L11 methyltransferase
MAWIKLSLDTTHEAVDWVRSLLAGVGYVEELQIREYVALSTESVEGETVGSNPNETDWAFSLDLYLRQDFQARGRIDTILNPLSSLQRTGLISEPSIETVEAKSSADQSEALIHRIGGRFVVLSPQASYEPIQADEIPLRLPPSLAFGSGLHPATILSLQLLERHVVPGMRVLDLGSGSGILSVAIAKLGGQVVALDNDPIAVEATQAAVDQNQVSEQVTVMAGSLGNGNQMGHWMGGRVVETVSGMDAMDAIADFDLIVANILARIHIALAKDYHRALRQIHQNPGLLITAGFTTDYTDEVVTALTVPGFTVLDRAQLDEWIALTYRL